MSADPFVPGSPPKATPLRLRGALTALALIVASLALLILAGEVIFRVFPSLLPAGTYATSVVNPELGVRLYSGPVVYNGVRLSRHEPNRLGFLDIEHPLTKRPGSISVGFFGDSYVESVQVPLERTFFRLLAKQSPDVEPFAFGQSGWGTLQGKRSYDAFGDRYSLDIVLYVFVENDPGDNALSIKGPTVSGALPLAVLSENGPGYEVRWTRPPDSVRYSQIKSTLLRPLLAKVFLLRLAALRAEGIRTQARNEDFEMSGRAPQDSAARPDPNLIPSSWPKAYRDEARILTERILRDWAQEVWRDGRRFGVVYVPRGEAQLSGSIPVADTWLPWLRAFAETESIPLLDLTPALEAATTPDNPTFDDHWSPHGHRVVAEALAKWLPGIAAATPESSSPDRRR